MPNVNLLSDLCSIEPGTLFQTYIFSTMKRTLNKMS